MKKILCMALCVMMVLSMFAGCGGQKETEPSETKHTHTWSETWSTNESSHWKVCSGCSLQAMMGAHMDDDMDGVCNDCGYEEPCQHTFNEEKWMSDASHHWHPATCKHEGQQSAKAVHVDEDQDGVCDVCAYLDTEHTHTYKPEWSMDQNEHWHEASCEHALTSDRAAHEDAENDGVCDVCGWYDASHTHTYGKDWTVDAGFHWHGATCEHSGAMKDRVRHADSDGDEFCDVCGYQMCRHEDFDIDGICDICGFEDPDHDHQFEQQWSADQTGHWHIGQCHPGATTMPEKHVDKNVDGNCDICNFVLCGHIYRQSWSSDDTHHWHLLECQCNVTVQKDLGEHVDNDDVPGCDICMHGYQAPSPVEILVDKQAVTITPTGMITWTEVTLNITTPGRYLITSNSTSVRWYYDKNQEDKPTSYASEVYFQEAGEVTVYAYYFDFAYAQTAPFDILLTVSHIDDLVLNTNRGKAELPTNMVYKVVFEAMEVGTWTLRTSINGVAMGTSLDDMPLTNTVDVVVANPGDMVELYVLMQDETNRNTFVFDWELTEPFQLDVGVGQTPVSVPAEGDHYKVVFTAPEDGRFLLNVTSEYLSFSEWGLGGFNKPVRTESTQQLTPELKKGETFTTWLQTVYNYPASTNVNDTLTIINVGTLLTLGDRSEMATIGYGPHTFTAEQDGTLIITLENAIFGFADDNGDIDWTVDNELVREMKAGESVEYYVMKDYDEYNIVRTINFLQTCTTTAAGQSFSILAKESTYYKISVVDGEIGITTNGVTQWVAAKEVDGQMVSSYEVKMVAGNTYVFQIRSNNGTVMPTVMPVHYEIDMSQMWNKDASSMLDMGKEYTVNMVPSKLYDLQIPDEMLKLKVKLNWQYKGVTVYVDGQVYKQGTEIFLQDLKTLTAKLQNNVAMDVTFSMTVTYAPVQEEAVTEGKLTLNKDMLFLVEAESQAKATYTAEVGGTYILTNFTNGAIIYVVDSMGQMGELVIANEGNYVFQLEADETIEFIILSANGEALTVQLTLSAPRP